MDLKIKQHGLNNYAETVRKSFNIFGTTLCTEVFEFVVSKIIYIWKRSVCSNKETEPGCDTGINQCYESNAHYFETLA